MKIINTVHGLVKLSSTPNSKPTKYQELLRVVVFVGVLVGTVTSDSVVGFFKARGKRTLPYTLKAGGRPGRCECTIDKCSQHLLLK